MSSPLLRRLRASPFLAILGLATLPAAAADLETRVLPAADYDQVRLSLIEAIETEGLVPGPVSAFGDMLHRTEADLGHGGDIYSRAEVFSFCSISVSARLVREDPDRIADCPLTVALYRLRGSSDLRLVYRPREGTSPGAGAANELLRRIVERTVTFFR